MLQWIADSLYFSKIEMISYFAPHSYTAKQYRLAMNFLKNGNECFNNTNEIIDSIAMNIILNEIEEHAPDSYVLPKGVFTGSALEILKEFLLGRKDMSLEMYVSNHATNVYQELLASLCEHRGDIKIVLDSTKQNPWFWRELARLINNIASKEQVKIINTGHVSSGIDIDLSSSGFCIDSIIYLLKCLQFIRIGKLDLSGNNISENSAEILAEYIKHIPLNELDISNCCLTPMGFKKISTVLDNKYMLNLNICANLQNELIEANTAECRESLELFCGKLHNNSKLRVLNLSNVNYDGIIEVIAPVIRENKHLLKLDVSSQNNMQGLSGRTNQYDITMLADSLISNRTLKHLDLSNLQLTTGQIETLSQYLPGCELETLDLSNNNFYTANTSDNSFTTLADGLASNSTLKDIKLRNFNIIADDRIDNFFILEQALQSSSTLQNIELTGNSIRPERLADFVFHMGSQFKLLQCTSMSAQDEDRFKDEISKKVSELGVVPNNLQNIRINSKYISEILNIQNIVKNSSSNLVMTVNSNLSR